MLTTSEKVLLEELEAAERTAIAICEEANDGRGMGLLEHMVNNQRVILRALMLPIIVKRGQS